MSLNAKIMNGSAPFVNLVRPDLNEYCKAQNLKFNEEVQTLMKAGQKVYHFGFGQSPFPVLEHMAEALKEFTTEAKYEQVAGIRQLREEICKFHERHDSLKNLNAENVIVGPGTKELIFLNMLVFNGPLMVLSPSWTTYRPQSRLVNNEAFIVETKPENDWRVTPDDVEKAVNDNNLTGNKILVMCNPDNPTGVTYTGDQLKALSDVFREHSIIVISDEIYGRLNYKQHHQCLTKYYPEGTILSSGMSKWASAGGWRVGYHIFPSGLSALREAVHSAASHTYSTCSAPMQYAVAKAFQDTARCDDYIGHTSRIMEAVGTYCYTKLTATGVKATRPAGGFYMFPNFAIIKEGLNKRGITTGAQMCEAMLKECRVALMSGGPAFLRPIEELTTRMCFVNFDGADGLAASRKLGLDAPLPDDFVRTYCLPVCEGVEALTGWVEKHKV